MSSVSGEGWDGGMTTVEPETSVQDCVLTLSVKPVNVFEVRTTETSILGRNMIFSEP